LRKPDIEKTQPWHSQLYAGLTKKDHFMQVW